MFQQTSINTVDQTYPQPNSSQVLVNIPGDAHSPSGSRASFQPPSPMSAINLPQYHPSSAGAATLSEHLPPAPTSASVETRVLSQGHPKDPTRPNSPTVELPEDRNIGGPAILLKNASVEQPTNNGHATPPPSFELPQKSGPDPLKRTSVDMTGDVDGGEGQQRKKPRLDSQENVTDHVEPQVAVSGTDMEVSNTTRIEAEEQSDDESDDEVIEIGPDGLRVEVDCMAALIEEVGENEKACKLCK